MLIKQICSGKPQMTHHYCCASRYCCLSPTHIHLRTYSYGRYCVLLIHGGIYADVDVLLSTDLDKLVEDDIGFMVPVDEVRSYNNIYLFFQNQLNASQPEQSILRHLAWQIYRCRKLFVERAFSGRTWAPHHCKNSRDGCEQYSQ